MPPICFDAYWIHILEYHIFLFNLLKFGYMGIRLGYYWTLICNFKPKIDGMTGQFALSNYREGQTFETY